MKTKYIFKTLALAMLMPAMVLTTACSGSDDIAVPNPETTEPIAKKGYPLQVTVNVTREGDDATRSTYNESTKKLSFSSGDQLFVGGTHSTAGKFAGTLSMTSSGQFSGIIYTENNTGTSWGTYDELFTGSNAHAVLLPNGYESYRFQTIEDKDTYSAIISIDYSKAFATTKAAAVEQFSYESGEYTSGTGFVLSPHICILNFTITDLTGNSVEVYFKDKYAQGEIKENVTVNEGTAAFAIGVDGAGTRVLNDCTLKVNNQTISLVSSSKTLIGGKIYNITRSASTLPEGALPGKFTINDGGNKVYFSKGNLRANNNSSWSWSFSPNQWDYVGHASANTNITGNGTVDVGGSFYVDLFGWSTSYTYGINNSTIDGQYSGTFNDWGSTISTSDPVWRTLTSDEWDYVFNTRTTGGTVGETSQARYTMATIRTDVSGGVNGVILFPDGSVNFASSEFYMLGTVNGASAWETKCTSAQWTALADKGCVFLPAAGYRNGTTVVNGGTEGYYWSSSTNTSDHAYAVRFYSGNGDPQCGMSPQFDSHRCYGQSVRLVRAVE